MRLLLKLHVSKHVSSPAAFVSNACGYNEELEVEPEGLN